MIDPIYLDYNATTPHDPEVIEAMRPFLVKEFGNPSSSHWYGIAPKRALQRAREQVAILLGCEPAEIIFTSGGTESNNQAISGAALAISHRGKHIITTAIEHPAVLQVCRHLERFSFETTLLPVDGDGLVDVGAVEKAISPETVLITIMHANNEVGTIQPIEDISRLAGEHDLIFHCDAAQSCGKIPVDVNLLGVDLLTIAGHKIYAPKGVGALYIRSGLELDKFMHGAGQEMGRRSGTENVLEIVGLGQACEIACRDLEKNTRHMIRMRDRLHRGLTERIKNIKMNGHSEKRLPNTLSLSFGRLEAMDILEEIGLDVAVSAGAACHSDSIEISHVLRAMGLADEWARGTLRFSVGKMTTEREIDRTIEVVAAAVGKLRP